MDTRHPIFDKEPLKNVNRYAEIDARNQESFLMTEGSSLQVLQSLHSAGAPRDILSEKHSDSFDDQTLKAAKKLSRVVLAGNMSPLNNYGPSHLSPEERIEDAKDNIASFLERHDVSAESVRILRPERDYTTPLSVINLDDAPMTPDDTGLFRPDQAGDMIYTYNRDIIMAARPADCPIVFVTAETPKGEITALLHLAWAGVAHGYVQQAKKQLDTLGIDWPSARAQITPGGHGDTYTFENFTKYNPAEEFPEAAGMFVDLEKTTGKEGEDAYNFGIDVAAEVYEQIIGSWEMGQRNVFADTSNTTAPESGYSSHSRTFKNYDVDGDNTRDLVLARHIS